MDAVRQVASVILLMLVHHLASCSGRLCSAEAGSVQDTAWISHWSVFNAVGFCAGGEQERKMALAVKIDL